MVLRILTFLCCAVLLGLQIREYRHTDRTAVEEIKGYCNKHDTCDTCRYGGSEEICMFQRITIPADWEVK